MSEKCHPHPQAYHANHGQLYSWYEKMLEGAMKTVATGDIRYVYESLQHINPNNWVETETQAMPYYEVKPGDTLSMIALQYGKTSANDILELRNLNRRIFLEAPHQLVAGYHLLIPLTWHRGPNETA